MVELLHECIIKVKKITEKSMFFHEDMKIKALLILFNMLLFSLFYCFKNYNGALFVIFFMFIYNVWYSLGNLRERLIFLIMNFAIFLFLLSRPCISAMNGEEWWYFKDESVWMALISLLMTLLFLNIGFTVGKSFIVNNKKYLHTKKRKQIINKFNFSVKILSNVCLCLFIIGVSVKLYEEIQKLIFMQGKDYALFYSEYKAVLPIYLRVFSTSMPYFLCGYLACLPSKKSVCIPLILYILSGIPGFLIGGRSALMIKLMFVFFYYSVRSAYEKDKDIWLGKFEKAVIIITIPIMVIGLGLYNYTRDNSSKSSLKNNIIVDFFYKQGTSFDTLCQGFVYKEELQSSPYVTSYTFGSIIDYAKHSTFAQLLFNAEDLDNRNSIEMANKSNSSAHHLSYLVMGKEYLDGHGRGTSYLIDTYMDFGYIGVILFSFFMGVLLFYFQTLAKQNSWLKRTIMLMTLVDLFMLPRAGATDFISFIFTLQFWLSVFMVLSLSVFIKYIKNFIRLQKD